MADEAISEPLDSGLVCLVMLSRWHGLAADVLFSSDPTFTHYVGSVDIDSEVLAVSNIKGYGQIPDLHIAMSLDSVDIVLNSVTY